MSTAKKNTPNNKKKEIIKDDDSKHEKNNNVKEKPKKKEIIKDDDSKHEKVKKTVVKQKSIKNLNKNVKSKEKLNSKELIEQEDDDNSTNKSEKNNKEKQTKKKTTPKNKKNKELEKEIDYSYLRLPSNKKVFELVNHDHNEKNTNKDYILSKIKQAHQILYEAENLEGENAMNDIMNWIFLRLLQQISSDKEEEGKIDFLNKKHYKDVFEGEELDEILSYFKLENLANLDLSSMRNIKGKDAIKKMGEILKVHPITEKIYIEENFIKAEKAKTIQNLLKNCILQIDMKKMLDNEDVIGDIYEFFINNYHKSGSKLGQFFTPRMMMKLVLEYKQKEFEETLKKEKDNYLVADMCMGTGGWLAMFYNMFKKTYANNIKLLGGEVKPNTFQFGLMNLITTLGKMPYRVQRDNSLTHIEKDKVNLIISNPPFKTDFKFSNVKTNYEHDKTNKIPIDEIYTLQDNNPPIQFLEMYLHKLKEGGKCIIVLPYGELFFSSSYKEARKHFLETTNIKEIILCPSGIFTHTDIKTCVLIFNKDKNGTTEITFSQINKECTNIIKITSVKREHIEKESILSFYHRDYLQDEYVENLTKKINNFKWIEFEKLFTLEKGKLQSSKVEEDENGKFPIISISEKNKMVLELNDDFIDGENIFIATTSSGTSSGPYETKIKYYNGKCSYTNLLHRFVLNNKNIKINLKYVYYYLTAIKNNIENTYEKGACNKSLDQKNFNRMKIPVPSIEIQNNIVTKMDNMHNSKNIYYEMIKSNEWKKTAYMDSVLKIYNNDRAQWIEFSKLFTLEKGKLQSSKVEEDENGITFVTGANSFKKITKQNISFAQGENIFISHTGNGDKVPIKYFDGECNYSDLMSLCVLDKDYKNLISNKYVYLYLLNLKTHIEDIYQKGSCNKSLDIKNFNRMKILMPHIDYQNKIVDTINKLENIEKILNEQLELINETINTAFMMELDTSGGETIDDIIKKALENCEF